MKTMLHSLSAVMVAAVWTGVIFGCGQKASEVVGEKVAEKAIEAGAAKEGVKAKVDISGDSVAIQTTEGSVTIGEKAEIPEDFPKDIPLYPGQTLVMVSSAAENQTFTVQAKTGDATEKVADHYKKEAPANGWIEETSVTQSGEQPMQLLVYKKDSRTLNVTVTKDTEGTMISLAATAQ
ncbi:MAG: hypothetical protein HY706_18390 [Candidatus Hydrogenedentes bacterium]|nr:hypothetical protein [Candidatus Hydrogenedentota bacterium]